MTQFKLPSPITEERSDQRERDILLNALRKAFLQFTNSPDTAGTSAPTPFWGEGEDGQDGLTIIGTPGAAGASGATGTQGAPGGPGTPGSDGEDGSDAWVRGAPGMAGAMGATGPANVPLFADDGADGMDGFIPGPTGTAGPIGAPGPASAGIFGNDGEDGIDAFVLGPQGVQGTTGSAGATGPTGAFIWGNDGEDGSDAWVKGANGVPGGSGAAGSAGATGPSGLPIWGNDGEDGDDAFVRGPTGQAGAVGVTGSVGPTGLAIWGNDGEDGVDAGARTPAYPAAPQVLVSGGVNSSPVGDPNFVFSGGLLSLGQATFDGKAHVALTDDTAPGTVTAWDNRHAVFGASGGTGGSVGVSHTASSGTGNVSFLSPNVAWEKARIQLASLGIYSGGTTLGLSQDGSGNNAVANGFQLTALAGNAGKLLKVDGSGNVGVVTAPPYASYKWSMNASSSAGILSDRQTVIVPGDSGPIATGAGYMNAAAGTAPSTTIASNMNTVTTPTAYGAMRAYTQVNFQAYQNYIQITVANGARLVYVLYNFSTNTNLATWDTGAMNIATGSGLTSGIVNASLLTVSAGDLIMVYVYRSDVAGTSVCSFLNFTVTAEFIA